MIFVKYGTTTAMQLIITTTARMRTIRDIYGFK